MEDSDLVATQQATQLQTQTQTQTQNQSPPFASWGTLRALSQGIETVIFSDNCYCFGRNIRGNQLVFPGKKISNYHAKIYRGEGSFDMDGGGVVILEDMSSNGTWVNFKKVGKGNKKFLNQGDEISFGGYLQGNATDPDNDYRFIFCAPSSQSQSDVQSSTCPVYELYTFKEKLGKGTFATVRLCIDKNSGAQRAVKIINKGRFANNPKTLMMFQREVNILRELKHDNVAKFIDYFEDESTIYIVMELVSGGDLLDYIMNQDGLTEDVTREITKQICAAMKYTHSKGITHRDLKPENILLQMNNLDKGPKIIAKVTDFGLAKMVDDQTFLRTMCGTPAYLAPEIVLQNGQDGYDQAVDSWSLGVIVYSMLTNASPFDDNEEDPLVQRVQKRQVQFETLTEMGFSPTCVDFVYRLLTNDPRNRMTLSIAGNHPWLRDPLSSDNSFTSMTQTTIQNTPVMPCFDMSQSDSNLSQGSHEVDKLQIEQSLACAETPEKARRSKLAELAEFSKNFDNAPVTPKVDSSIPMPIDDSKTHYRRALMNAESMSDVLNKSKSVPPSEPLPDVPRKTAVSQWSDSTPESSQAAQETPEDSVLRPHSSLHIPLQPLSLNENNRKENDTDSRKPAAAVAANNLKRKAELDESPVAAKKAISDPTPKLNRSTAPHGKGRSQSGHTPQSTRVTRSRAAPSPAH